MEPDYHTIAASAELLHERIRNDHRGSPDQAADRSEEVRDLLSDLNERHVETVWARRDDDPSALAAHVAFQGWPSGESLPGWITEFERIVDVVCAVEDPVGTRRERHADVPFVDVLAPIADRNRGLVTEHVETTLVGPAALDAFQRVLLDQLADVAAQALHIDFVRYVSEQDPEVVRAGLRSPDSTEWYEAYVATWYDGRAEQFFEEFSVAAKLLSIVCSQWRTVVTRFADRLHEDSGALCALLARDSVDRVTDVTPLGDAHGGNDRVTLVEVGGTDEVFYKPRSVDPEVGLYDFQTWLCEAFDDVPDLETPGVVDREGYGWVEKVAHADHADIEPLERYFRSAGALLAVVYLLNVTDCHCENVVAADRSPVIVDPETVLEMGYSAGATADTRLNERLRRRLMTDSVIGTGLLPHDAVPEHASGYAGVTDRTSEFEQLVWTDVNTDAMDVEYVRPTSDPAANFPTCRGSPVAPDHFVDELADGFGATYRSIEASRDRVATAVERYFGDVETRVLLRSSRAYGGLLDTLRSPKYLRNGARFDLKIQRTLSMRPADPVFRRETKLPALAPDDWDEVVDAEREALQRGDIPKFTMYSDDPGLYFDGTEVLPSLTVATGLGRIRARLETFSSSDRRHQVGLLRGCLAGPDHPATFHPEGEI